MQVFDFFVAKNIRVRRLHTRCCVAFFFATFSGTGAGRGEIDLSQQKGVLIWRMHDINA